jgi:hypothetical protein
LARQIDLFGVAPTATPTGPGLAPYRRLFLRVLTLSLSQKVTALTACYLMVMVRFWVVVPVLFLAVMVTW